MNDVARTVQELKTKGVTFEHYELPGLNRFEAQELAVKVLQRAGLIEQGRQAQWRPCRLKADRLRDVAVWIDQYRRHWEESFERLDAYLREIAETEQPEGDDDASDPNRPR